MSLFWVVLLTPVLMSFLVYSELHSPLLQVLDERAKLTDINEKGVKQAIELIYVIDNKLINRLVLIDNLGLVITLITCAIVFTASVSSKKNRQFVLRNKSMKIYLLFIAVIIPATATHSINEIHNTLTLYQSSFFDQVDHMTPQELQQELLSYIKYTTDAFPWIVIPTYALCIFTFLIWISFRLMYSKLEKKP